MPIVDQLAIGGGAMVIDCNLQQALDLLRPRYRKNSDGTALDPVGVHAVRAVRDLAGAGAEGWVDKLRPTPRVLRAVSSAPLDGRSTPTARVNGIISE